GTFASASARGAGRFAAGTRARDTSGGSCRSRRPVTGSRSSRAAGSTPGSRTGASSVSTPATRATTVGRCGVAGPATMGLGVHDYIGRLGLTHLDPGVAMVSLPRLLVVAAAAVTFLAPGLGAQSDQETLARYRLTEAALAKFTQASRNFIAAAKADSTTREDQDEDESPKS